MWIELTNLNGDKILMNMDVMGVVEMCGSRDAESCLTFKGGLNSIYVKESYAEIAAALKAVSAKGDRT